MEISVVIPLYNKKKTVLRALNSVLQQTFLPQEIIVVNDGSTDGSDKLIAAELNHPLIQLVNQQNAGVSAARNKGIELAKSKWISFLDADDFWDESYLETISTLHIKFPKAKVLASNYKFQDHSGNFSNTRLNKFSFNNQQEGLLVNYFEVAAHSSPPICSSAVVVSQLALLNIGGFPLGIKSGEDLITWAKLAVQNNIAYTTKALATFVLDPAHSYEKKPSRLPQKPDVVGDELEKLLQHNASLIGLKQYVAHWHKMRASIYLRLGNRKECLFEILKSARYTPFNKKLWMYLVFLFLPLKMVNFIFKKAT